MPKTRALSSLDPAVLDRISGLDFVARRVVEGFLAGQHRSPHSGSSVEFAQHREYVPGDDLRHVDWKIFAKSERLVVKEYVEETNLTCHLLVDASESMSYGSLNRTGSEGAAPGAAPQVRTKFDYARWTAAALAHLVISQRDTAGLVLFDEEARHRVPPGGGAAQRVAILRTLEEATPSGATQVGEVLTWFASRLRTRGIVAVFSDFFDDLDTIVSGLRRLVHGGHEPILFQILDPRELDFDFNGYLRLDGLEGSGQAKIDPVSIRAAYREEVEKHQEQLRHHSQALGLDLVSVSTSTPLDVCLSTYLGKRTARSRGRS